MSTKEPRLNATNLKKAKKILIDVVNLLDKYNVDYHLEGGTLLGLVRDGDLLPWDHDVDISILCKDALSFLKLRKNFFLKGYKVTIRKSLDDFGPIVNGDYSVFKVKPILPYMLQIFYPKEKENYIVLDVFVKTSNETHIFWQAKGKVMRVDSRYYNTFEIVCALGRTFKVPNHYKDYLTEKYGDWSVPIKVWDCGENEKTIFGVV